MRNTTRSRSVCFVISILYQRTSCLSWLSTSCFSWLRTSCLRWLRTSGLRWLRQTAGCIVPLSVTVTSYKLLIVYFAGTRFTHDSSLCTNVVLISKKRGVRCPNVPTFCNENVLLGIRLQIKKGRLQISSNLCIFKQYNGFSSLPVEELYCRSQDPHHYQFESSCSRDRDLLREEAVQLANGPVSGFTRYHFMSEITPGRETWVFHCQKYISKYTSKFEALKCV